MERFARLFGGLLLFVYHCFDLLVIHRYLSGLSRPEQVVCSFRQVVGVPAITKEVLSRRTNDYQGWIEAFARNHSIPFTWAEKGVRKQDDLRPHLRRMRRRQQYGIYFILKSTEQGSTFRSSAPKYPTADPNYRILARQHSRFTHYYFYLRDEALGPMVMRVASSFPFLTTYYLNSHRFIEQELNDAFCKNDIAFLSVADPPALQATADRFSPELIRGRLEYWAQVLGPKFSRRERAAMNLGRFYAVRQVEYCRNFAFQRHFPIHKIFERSGELGLWQLTAHKISEIFGTLLTRRLPGKLHTSLEQIERGHHIFRAYWKNGFLKQYEKFSTFLRRELCSHNLTDFGLRKGVHHLTAARQKFLEITDRFATFQAQTLKVHVDCPLLQSLASIITRGAARFPGLKIHDTRLIRLMEVLRHGGTRLAGWRAPRIHQAVLTTYALASSRYDLRKMRAHGLLDRDGHRYAYRLTDRGVKVAVLFVPHTKLEAAFHKVDNSIHQIIELLEAA